MICNFFIGPPAEAKWPWPGLQLGYVLNMYGANKLCHTSLESI